MTAISVREAYGKALVALGERNPDVMVLDADVSNSTRTIHFAQAFPERFLNLGIAEANMMSVAAGLATCGKIAFANTFSFLAALKAGDPVRSLIAYNRLNVKIAGAYSGLSDSKDGASHQSVCDIAVMRSLPNMAVVVVADAVETELAVPKVAQWEGPVFLRLSRAELPVVFDRDHPFEIGRGNVLRQGTDVTLVATGYMVQKTLEAVERLVADGLDPEVIEIHTLKPLDCELLADSAKQTGALVTLEEHSIIGGLGSAVCEALCGCCPVPVLRLGVEDQFGQSGSADELLVHYGLTAAHAVELAHQAVALKESR